MMTLAESIRLLEACTGLVFTQNEQNGQVESRIGDWRISISSFTADLTANLSEVKILCATLTYSGCEAKQKASWKTGQRFATYSVRSGLLLICNWLNGFRSAVGLESEE